MFEYYVENVEAKPGKMEEYLNKMAAEKWELHQAVVTPGTIVCTFTMILKRWKKLDYVQK